MSGPEHVIADVLGGPEAYDWAERIIEALADEGWTLHRLEDGE